MFSFVNFGAALYLFLNSIIVTMVGDMNNKTKLLATSPPVYFFLQARKIRKKKDKFIQSNVYSEDVRLLVK